MKKIMLCCLAILCLGITSFSQEYLTGSFRIWLHQDNVKFKDNRSSDYLLNTTFEKFGVTSVKQSFPWAKRAENKLFYDVAFTGNDTLFINEIRSKLMHLMNPPIRYGIPISLYQPSDILADSIWHLKKIQANLAWDIERGNKDTKIAVIDTHFDPAHPDLADQLLYTYDPKDTTMIFDSKVAMLGSNWHGTTVAGFVAGQTTDSNLTQPIGAEYASIGYNNKIIPFQKNDMLGKALFASTVMHADVISISAYTSCIMTDSHKRAATSIIKEILDNGTVIVSAAGNGFCNGCYENKYGDTAHSSGCKEPVDFEVFTPPYPFSPTLDSRIICVTGVTSGDSLTKKIYDPVTHQIINKTLSYFEEVDVSSPGHELWGLQTTIRNRVIDTIQLWDTITHLPWFAYDTTYIINDHPFWNGFGGTSFATPIVAGLASLIKAHVPWLTAAEVEWHIKKLQNVDSVQDWRLYKNPVSQYSRTGSGRINAWKALKSIENLVQNYNICDGTEVIWNDTVYVKDTVRICRGSTLRVKSDVFFRPTARVIVECGGELIIDGGRLTGSPSHMWKGVLAYSNPEISQSPYNQSVVTIINNGIIEKAETAISAVQDGFNPDWPGYTNGGAIIQCSDAVFKNNIYAIKLNPYKYSSFSKFINCSFVNDVEYLDYKIRMEKFVEITAINGVQFEGCLFENKVLGSFGYGIYSYNSSFIVDDFCTGIVLPCPEENIIKSTFLNLKYGVYCIGSAGIHPVTIENCKMANNSTAAYSGGIVGFTFKDNQISVTPDSSANVVTAHSCGLYLDGSTGYEVIRNKFYGKSFNPTNDLTIGVIVNNSGPENNFIKNNTFYNLDYAIHAQGRNRSKDGLSGLEIRCNRFNGCLTDISVFGDTLNTPKLGIKMYQGNLADSTSADPAGNIFSRLSSSEYYSIRNDAFRSSMTYLHHKPNLIKDRVVPFTVIEVDLVMSRHHYDSIYSCILANGGANSNTLINSVNTLKANYSNEYNYYSRLIDNGNSDSIVEKIEYSYPYNASELQPELLSVSPYLSDTVLYSTIKKEDVFNNAMVRDLLISNIHGIKQTQIQQAVDDRSIPMPDEMYNQIYSLIDSLSSKEIIESKISQLKSITDEIYRSSIRQQGITDSLFQLYDSINLLQAKIDKALILVETGNYVEAHNAVLQMIPLYMGSDSLDFKDYIWYLQTIAQYNSIDSIPFSVLQNLQFNNEVVRAFNRNVMIHRHSIGYEEPYLFTNLNKSHKIRVNTRQLNTYTDTCFLRVYPNPVKRFITIAYKLPENLNKAHLKLYNMEGKVQWVKELTGSYNEQVMFLNEKPGTYILELSCVNRRLDSVKLTIIE